MEAQICCAHSFNNSKCFGDTEIEILDDENEETLELTQYFDWSQIRDDSTLLELLNTTDLEGIDSLMESTSNSVEDC